MYIYYLTTSLATESFQGKPSNRCLKALTMVWPVTILRPGNEIASLAGVIGGPCVKRHVNVVWS